MKNISTYLFLIVLLTFSCSKEETIVDPTDIQQEEEPNYQLFDPSGQTSVLVKYPFNDSQIRILGENVNTTGNTYDPQSVIVTNNSTGQNVHIFSKSNSMYKQMILFSSNADGDFNNHYLILESTIDTAQLFAYIFEYDFDTEKGNFLFKLELNELIPNMETCLNISSDTNPYLKWMCQVSNNNISDIKELNIKIRTRFLEMNNAFLEIKEDITTSLESLSTYKESVSIIIKDDPTFLRAENVTLENEKIVPFEGLYLQNDESIKYTVSVNEQDYRCGISNQELSEPILLSIKELNTEIPIPELPVNFSLLNPEHGSVSASDLQTNSFGEVITNWTLGSIHLQELFYFFPDTNPFHFDFRNLNTIKADFIKCNEKIIDHTFSRLAFPLLTITFACADEMGNSRLNGCEKISNISYVGENKNGLENGQEIPFTITSANQITIAWHDFVLFGSSSTIEIPIEIRFDNLPTIERVFFVNKPL